jgi:hypothetical protein
LPRRASFWFRERDRDRNRENKAGQDLGMEAKERTGKEEKGYQLALGIIIIIIIALELG